MDLGDSATEIHIIQAPQRSLQPLQPSKPLRLHDERGFCVKPIVFFFLLLFKGDLIYKCHIYIYLHDGLMLQTDSGPHSQLRQSSVDN